MTITLCTSPPFPYIYVSGGLLRSMGFCMQGSQHAAGGDGDPACGGDEDPADEDPAEDLDKDLHLHSAGTRENWCRSKELCIMCGSCDMSRERVEGLPRGAGVSWVSWVAGGGKIKIITEYFCRNGTRVKRRVGVNSPARRFTGGSVRRDRRVYSGGY